MKITKRQLRRIIREQSAQDRTPFWYDAIAQFLWDNASASGLDLTDTDPWSAEDANEIKGLIQALKDLATDIERGNF